MPTPNVSELATVTIESRRRKLSDNVTQNTALLAKMKQKKRMRTFGGGEFILEEFTYAENSSFGWYSGYDILNIQPTQVLSAARFPMRLCSVAISMSGEETLKNAGRERMIDLLAARVENAEMTMKNRMSASLYSDGTGYQGRELTGIQSIISITPATGVVGGVDRSAWTFWRNQTQQVSSGAVTSGMRALWLKLCRGSEHPDLISMDSEFYSDFWGDLQSQERYADEQMASYGFRTLKFQNADVIMDSGIGGDIPANRAYFNNTDYLFWRPHADRDMVAMSPDRHAVNQDAVIKIIGWAGNLTCSNCMMQGVLYQ